MSDDEMKIVGADGFGADEIKFPVPEESRRTARGGEEAMSDTLEQPDYRKMVTTQATANPVIADPRDAACLLCHWQPSPDKGSHMPEISHASGAYVCKECNTCAKTVDSFGLTVEELKIAAANYKAALSASQGIAQPQKEKQP